MCVGLPNVNATKQRRVRSGNFSKEIVSQVRERVVDIRIIELDLYQSMGPFHVAPPKLFLLGYAIQKLRQIFLGPDKRSIFRQNYPAGNSSRGESARRIQHGLIPCYCPSVTAVYTQMGQAHSHLKKKKRKKKLTVVLTTHLPAIGAHLQHIWGMLRCEISLLDVTNSQTEMTPRSTRVAKIFASFLSSSPSYEKKTLFCCRIRPSVIHSGQLCICHR